VVVLDAVEGCVAASSFRTGRGLGLAVENLPDVRSPVSVLLARGEVAPGGLFEVRGLREDHQFVERIYSNSREKLQAHPKTNPAQEVHQLVEG
jgi:hypothetical protein